MFITFDLLEARSDVGASLFSLLVGKWTTLGRVIVAVLSIVEEPITDYMIGLEKSANWFGSFLTYANSKPRSACCRVFDVLVVLILNEHRACS